MNGSAHLHEVGPLDAEDELQVLHGVGHPRASVHNALDDGGLCKHGVVLHPTTPPCYDPSTGDDLSHRLVQGDRASDQAHCLGDFTEWSETQTAEY